MNENKGLLLVFSTAIISGVSIYVNSLGVKFGNAYVFTGMKNLLVGILLISVIFLLKDFKKIKQLKRPEWLKLLLIGLIGGAVPFLLFFQGLTMTLAAKGSFIHKTLFIFVSFLAVYFLKEKFNKSMMVGLGALLVGLVLFLGIQPQSLAWGDLLILIATIMWAVEIIISKKLLKTISPNIVAWGRMFFGGLFIMLFLVNIRQIGEVFVYNPQQWLWIGITSVFLLGYVMTFYHGLKHVRASVATAILSLGAPITALITLIVDDGIDWAPQKTIGVFLMILGIIAVIGLSRIKILIAKDKLYDRIDS